MVETPAVVGLRVTVAVDTPGTVCHGLRHTPVTQTMTITHPETVTPRVKRTPRLRIWTNLTMTATQRVRRARHHRLQISITSCRREERTGAYGLTTFRTTPSPSLDVRLRQRRRV
ncbi:hypothetical protein HAZT_HAZT009580 [Hyalella azteca]|uniref:Uncharacterized protein n=1 Tax=Hyalella azteca TaxID=294128 RepID=A0A6A0GXI3_HYAAZ|nr:hypothetical protein HAZT_HAZT009580 [Hyalella azteca]